MVLVVLDKWDKLFYCHWIQHSIHIINIHVRHNFLSAKPLWATSRKCCYPPITSNGNERSGLNYSSRMSNNACRVLFRVGADPLNYSAGGFSFSENLHRGSDVCESLISLLEPSVILSWPWLSPEHQHWRWQRFVFFPCLQTSSAESEGLQGVNWLPSQVSLVSVYTFCLAVLCDCQCITKSRLLFTLCTMRDSVFYPRCVVVR